MIVASFVPKLRFAKLHAQCDQPPEDACWRGLFVQALANGKWASKLGRGHDIHHLKLESIGGKTKSMYGDATHFFERPKPAVPRPQMPNIMYEFATLSGVTNATMVPPKKSKPAKAGLKGKR